MKNLIFCLLLALASGLAIAKDVPPKEYEAALDLIHAYSGAGDELTRAREIIKKLATSHPKGGYAQTLTAEAMSTWHLDQRGQPPEMVANILKLTEEAIRLNPGLAQAHVARARALVRSGAYDDAERAVDAALKLDPALAGAYFLRAEIFRRTSRPAEAENWYLKFINATPSPTRKSNGYYWMAIGYQQAPSKTPAERASALQKARGAYEKMLEFDPKGAWKNVNYAIFLNNEVGDFDAAERYANRALDIMDFPMARYHLALARYQKLPLDDPGLRGAVEKVAKSTGVTLADASGFSQRYAFIGPRMQKLQASVARGK